MIGIEPSTAQTNLHNIRPSDLELPATRSIGVTEPLSRLKCRRVRVGW